MAALLLFPKPKTFSYVRHVLANYFGHFHSKTPPPTDKNFPLKINFIKIFLKKTQYFPS
jgi:hypothetical protein